MAFQKTVLSAVICAVLGGCANIAPMEHASGKPVTPKAVEESMAMTEAWNAPPVVQDGKAAVVLLSPYAVPDDIRAKKLSLELEPGATVKDVVAVLGKLGIPIILADETVASKEFFLPHFKGDLGTLLSAITRVTDVWFTWHEGTIVVSSSERIGISLPQESGFSDQFSKGLDALGVKDRSISWQAGMAVMDITPSQFRKVRSFLERITSNAAIVSLQVAVVNVTLNQTAKQGIDWDKLQVSTLRGGNLNDLKTWQSAATAATTPVGTTPPVATPATTPATTGTGTTATATPTTSTTTSALGAVASLGLTGSGLSGALFSGRFSFTGMFNFLQNYGEAETKQNVVLKTVAGNKVEFKSLTQIPYVAEVGVTTTAGSTAAATTGSSRTDKADDGITVEMTPMFDASANSVTIDLKLSIKAVVAFNELSAGNQIGKLTQPTTAERSFTDTLRLRPGETAVVGGLTYDSVSDNKGSPAFLTGTKLESQSLTVNRQTMFIVVRPTVVKLGQALSAETGESLDLLPGGKSLPGDPPAKKVGSKTRNSKQED